MPPETPDPISTVVVRRASRTGALPDVIVQAMSPFAIILVRAARVYLQTAVGLVTTGALAGTLALIPGCAVTPGGKDPTLTIPVAWRNAADFPTASPDRDLATWWSDFGDAQSSLPPSGMQPGDLQPGTWVELRVEGQWVRCQLAWSSPRAASSSALTSPPMPAPTTMTRWRATTRALL